MMGGLGLTRDSLFPLITAGFFITLIAPPTSTRPPTPGGCALAGWESRPSTGKPPETLSGALGSSVRATEAAAVCGTPPRLREISVPVVIFWNVRGWQAGLVPSLTWKRQAQVL